MPDRKASSSTHALALLKASAVLKLVDVLTEKRSREVVSVTAGRGRGKSAALGLGVVAAIDLGLNNIFVTSPSPHNLNSFFQVMFLGELFYLLALEMSTVDNKKNIHSRMCI